MADFEKDIKKAVDLSNEGRTWEALNIYDKILDSEPEYEPALMNKAILNFQDKKYKEVLELVSKVKSEANIFDVKFIEANCHFLLGNIEMAEKTYNVLSSYLNENNDLIFKAGMATLQQGFYLVSVKMLGKIDTKKSLFFEKNYYMALAYKAMGDLSSSIKCFGYAIREKSDSFQLYPLIATTCFQNGMIEEGDKLMNILREKNNRFFQHVAGIVADYRKS